MIGALRVKTILCSIFSLIHQTDLEVPIGKNYGGLLHNSDSGAPLLPFLSAPLVTEAGGDV